MNSIKKFALTALALLGVSLGFTACQDDVDAPSTNEPVATKKASMTILELKQKYWDEATNYIKPIGGHYVDAEGNTIPFEGNANVSYMKFVPDEGEYVIKGTVVSSDEAGNVFKNLVIQDETAAITLSINSYNLYLKYRPGQEVVIDVQGMFIGKYNGLQQLGYPEWYANGSAWEATFMSPEFFREHVELNGWPEKANIDTIAINSFSELATNTDGLMKWQSQLVRFNNISFAEGGTGTFSEYHETMNQTIYDADGNSLIVRTSGYSNFWNKTLPAGRGDLVAICSYYGTTGWQLILNDYEGCMNFGNPTEVGTENKPYSVSDAIAIEQTGRLTSGWVTGYIVGAVAPEVTTVSSNDDIEWGAPTVLNNTLVFAESADCKNWQECLIVSLTAGSAFQTYGNLRTNPDNLGKQVWVKGTLDKYMSAYGVTGNNGKSSEFKIEGVDVPSDEPVIVDGNGTKEAPYQVTQVINGATGTSVWVTGYIVGTVTDKTWPTDCEFSATNASNTNFILATAPDVTDPAKCIPVQLPTTVRDALSVQKNPTNIGRQVSICGSLESYFSQPGVKSVTEYVFGTGGGETPTPGTGTGDGSETSPYTCAQVTALNPQSTSEPVATGVWVEGYIVGWADMSSTYYINDETARFTVPATMATNILLADSPTVTSVSQCIGVQLPSGSVRSALNLVDNPGNLGQKASVYGNIAKYSGVAGVRETTKYKLDNQGSDTPSTGNELYSAPFLGVGQGDFIINNVVMPSDLSYVWAYDATYGMKASAYANGTRYATESWLISPVFDMANASNVVLTFDHGANYFTSIATEATVWVSIDGADWTQLTVPTYPTSWTFVSSGDISLAAYAGKKVQIGFKYTSTSSVAGTWEIKNFLLSGDGSITTSAAQVPGGGSGDQPGTDQPSTDGQGTESNPYTVSDVQALNPQSTTEPVASNVWVKGYIVGWANMDLGTAINETTAIFTTPATMNTNILIAETPTAVSYREVIGVQLPSGDVRNGLNLVTNPDNLGKEVMVCGNIAKYSGVAGVRSTSAYVLGAAADEPGTDEPGTDEPGEVVSGNTADFSTFNEGAPNVTTYGTYTTTDGWTTENCIIGCGGTFNNVDYSFISSDAQFLFPILNGRTDKQGKLTSPVLANGCGTVAFKWGFPYSDTVLNFTVYIYQDGKEVAKDSYEGTGLAKGTVYTYSHDFNVAGNFQIVIVNDMASAQTKNKDRMAIWDLTWTSVK